MRRSSVEGPCCHDGEDVRQTILPTLGGTSRDWAADYPYLGRHFLGLGSVFSLPVVIVGDGDII